MFEAELLCLSSYTCVGRRSQIKRLQLGGHILYYLGVCDAMFRIVQVSCQRCDHKPIFDAVVPSLLAQPLIDAALALEALAFSLAQSEPVDEHLLLTSPRTFHYHGKATRVGSRVRNGA